MRVKKPRPVFFGDLKLGEAFIHEGALMLKAVLPGGGEVFGKFVGVSLETGTMLEMDCSVLVHPRPNARVEDSGCE